MMKLMRSYFDAFSLIVYFLKMAAGISKKYVVLTLVAPIASVIYTYSLILFPAQIINELTGARQSEKIGFYSVLMVVILLVSGIVKSRLSIALELNNAVVVNGFLAHINNKVMELDYEVLENPAFLDLRNEVVTSINDRQLIVRIIENIQGFIVQTINLVSYGALLLLLNPLLIAVMVILVFLNNIVNNKAKEVNMNIEKMMIAYGRRVGYFESLTSDFKIGKDARIYDVKGMLEEEIDNFNNTTFQMNRKAMRVTGMLDGLMSINEQIQMFIVYVYIIYCVIQGMIDLGDFAMYTGAALQFGRSLFAIVNHITDYRFIQYHMARFHDLLTYANGDAQMHNISIEDVPGYRDSLIIEFHNVSFRYPREYKDTLKDVNVKLSGTDHITIVGENGAGKTTFIKLLCGLYAPTKGAVTLNGVDIHSVKPEEYRKLISVVFQDYKLFACSVSENVAFSSSDGDIMGALKMASMEETVFSLKYNSETMIYKVFDEEGIEPSGGQGQKLALARAFYKGAPIFILDEPTAALDPYAEHEVFEKVNEATKDQLVMFISHRMSSCKFSDRVLVFHGGEIIQSGSHEELMKEKEGKYFEMFMVQSQYYALP